MSPDLVVRAVAGAILVLAFAAACAITVHGYWQDPGYQIPGVVSLILGSAVSASLTLLGVNVGHLGYASAVTQAAQAARNGSPEAGRQARPGP